LGWGQYSENMSHIHTYIHTFTPNVAKRDMHTYLKEEEGVDN